MTPDPYRSPGPLARLAPPAPWWRIAWAWHRGLPRRLEEHRIRLDLRKMRARLPDDLIRGIARDAAMLGVGYPETLPDGGFRHVPVSAMRHPPPPFLPPPADPTKVSQ